MMGREFTLIMMAMGGTTEIVQSSDWFCTTAGLSVFDTDCDDGNSTIYPVLNCDGLNACEISFDPLETDDDDNMSSVRSIPMMFGVQSVVGGDDCNDGSDYISRCDEI